MALSVETLEEVIKPDLRQVYDIEKNNWLPRNDTPEHATKQPMCIGRSKWMVFLLISSSKLFSSS
jgi:hypothetical protein